MITLNPKQSPNIEKQFKALATYGLDSITVRFDGCGDDGQIVDIQYEKRKGKDSVEVKNPPKLRDEHRSLAHYSNSDPETFREFVESLTYEVLEASGFDWINNDGGFGEVCFIMPDWIVIHMNVRESRSFGLEFRFGAEGANG